MSHTPGPWHAHRGPFGEGWQISGTRSEGIAEIVGHVGQAQEDDVYLIAAAPDLLAACQLFEAWYRGESRLDSPDSQLGMIDRVIQEAVAKVYTQSDTSAKESE